jgi:hypothetical protein
VLEFWIGGLLYRLSSWGCVAGGRGDHSREQVRIGLRGVHPEEVDEASVVGRAAGDDDFVENFAELSGQAEERESAVESCKLVDFVWNGRRRFAYRVPFLVR